MSIWDKELETEARNVFNFLDDQNLGHITIDKFKNAFLNFSKDDVNNEAEEAFDGIISKMKPNSNGEITFDNFCPAFIDKMMNENRIDPKSSRMKSKAQYSIRRFLSVDTSDSESLEIDKSPVVPNIPENKQMTNEIDYTYEPCQKEDAKSDLNKHFNHTPRKIRELKHRDSWPTRKLSLHDPCPNQMSSRHSNFSTPQQNFLSPTTFSATGKAHFLLSAGASPHASKSDICRSTSDICTREAMDDNFDTVKQQIRRLEDKLTTFHSDQFDLENKETQNLKEENEMLHRRINNLEDNMKDLEEWFDKRIEEEKNEMKTKTNKFDEEKQCELDILDNRRMKLETDNAEIILELAQCKDEMQCLKTDKHALHEELSKTDMELSNLQEELEHFKESSKKTLNKLVTEKEEFEKNIESLCENFSTVQQNPANPTAESEYSSNHTELLSRKKELDEMVSDLQREKDNLTRQLAELNCQLDGSLAGDSSCGSIDDDASLAALQKELELKTKEELMDVLSGEKDANFKLKDYIEKIILRVMEKHPDLLEIK